MFFISARPECVEGTKSGNNIDDFTAVISIPTGWDFVTYYGTQHSGASTPFTLILKQSACYFYQPSRSFSPDLSGLPG
jgi:hypothetical protein